jgi:ribosomal protein L29
VSIKTIPPHRAKSIEELKAMLKELEKQIK